MRLRTKMFNDIDYNIKTVQVALLTAYSVFEHDLLRIANTNVDVYESRRRVTYERIYRTSSRVYPRESITTVVGKTYIKYHIIIKDV